jgi:homogentisate 1,2-dioxygenase
MSAHGPDRASYEAAIAAPLKPVHLERTLAFMFESRYLFEPTAHALASETLDKDYDDAWSGFEKAALSAPATVSTLPQSGGRKP